jgi:hypothetical protein
MVICPSQNSNDVAKITLTLPSDFLGKAGKISASK